MTEILVTAFTGIVPAELLAAPTDRPSVLVTWEVLAGAEGLTLRFDVAASTHPRTPTDLTHLAGYLHALAHTLAGGFSFPSQVDLVEGGETP